MLSMSIMRQTKSTRLRSRCLAISSITSTATIVVDCNATGWLLRPLISKLELCNVNRLKQGHLLLLPACCMRVLGQGFWERTFMNYATGLEFCRTWIHESRFFVKSQNGFVEVSALCTLVNPSLFLIIAKESTDRFVCDHGWLSDASTTQCLKNYFSKSKEFSMLDSFFLSEINCWCLWKLAIVINCHCYDNVTVITVCITNLKWGSYVYDWVLCWK